MNIRLVMAAAIGAIGLAACEPVEKTSDAVSAPVVPADGTTTSPAIADPVGGAASGAPPAPGATPPDADRALPAAEPSNG